MLMAFHNQLIIQLAINSALQSFFIPIYISPKINQQITSVFINFRIKNIKKPIKNIQKYQKLQKARINYNTKFKKLIRSLSYLQNSSFSFSLFLVNQVHYKLQVFPFLGLIYPNSKIKKKFMSTPNQLPNLNFNLNVPQFTAMRITPPLELEPIKIASINLDYSNSQYEPFSKELLTKLGVKFQEEKGMISSLISGMGCLSCTACKAMSRDTLMQINSKDLFSVQKGKQNMEKVQEKSEQTQDEQNKQRFEKVWKQQKKRHLRPSMVKFQAAYKKHRKLSIEDWEKKINEYFG